MRPNRWDFLLCLFAGLGAPSSNNAYAIDRVPVEATRPSANATAPTATQPADPSAVSNPRSLGNGIWPSDTARNGSLNPAGSQPTPLIRTIGQAAAVPAPRDALDRQVDEAIDITSRRILSVETHTPWQIGHGMLAYRRDYVVRKEGEKVLAYEWVRTNPTFNGRTWFRLTPYGAGPQKFTVPYEFEGHPNQFLAFFALARLPLDYTFEVGGKTVTFGDMLNNAKLDINDREEITWTLWLFSYYLDSDAQWRSADGQPWSMERLVATQLRHPVEKSACGGCHGLFALSSARNSYLQTGHRLQGVWLEAEMFINRYTEQARIQQNRDGSFSSNYFKGPGYTADESKRISTTGHTLEFLMMALPQNRLGEPWVRSAVQSIARDLITHKADPLEVGGMYHAAHALVLYRERTRPMVAAQPTGVRPASAEQELEVGIGQ